MGISWSHVLLLSAIDWGNAPAWVGGFLTGGGVSVAGYNVWRAVTDARSQAARKVWAMPPTRDMLQKDELDDGPPSVPWMIIRNGSDEPVFECVVRVLPWDWRTNPEPVLRSPIFPCIYPNDHSEPFPLTGVEHPPWKPGRDHLVPLRIEFTDGQGRRWCRTPDARLKRMKVGRSPT